MFDLLYHDPYVDPFVLAEIERRGRYDLLNPGRQRGCSMADQMRMMGVE